MDHNNWPNWHQGMRYSLEARTFDFLWWGMPMLAIPWGVWVAVLNGPIARMYADFGVSLGTLTLASVMAPAALTLLARVIPCFWPKQLYMSFTTGAKVLLGIGLIFAWLALEADLGLAFTAAGIDYSDTSLLPDSLKFVCVLQTFVIAVTWGAEIGYFIVSDHDFEEDC